MVIVPCDNCLNIRESTTVRIVINTSKEKTLTGIKSMIDKSLRK